MNIKQAAASIAAATLLAGGPALALADPNASPVAVNTASLAPITINRTEIQLPAVSGQMAGFGLNEVYSPASVTVSFRNTSAVTATNVIFQLDENGTPDGQIDDAGSFAPGATIVHQLSADPRDANEHLSVVEVKFADGSVWLKDARALRQASQQH